MNFASPVGLSALAAVLATPVAAEARARPRHHADAVAGPSTAAQLKIAQAEISALQARLNALEAKIDQQGSAQQAVASQATTQAEAATQLASSAAAKADQAEVKAEAASTTAAHPPIPRALAWASNTQVNGRMFFNASTITQHTNGGPAASTGTGFNIKRFYLGVDHQFSPVFAGSVLMDISNVIGETANLNYTTPTTSVAASSCTTVAVAATKTAPASYKTTCVAPAAASLGTAALVGKGFYVKNAFLQAKLDPALIIRAGAAPLPWVPYIENQYGFRHIENETIDRLSYGTTADWGIHVLGDIAGGLISYQVSAIDGGGYRNVKVTKYVDFEGRLSAQYHGLWAAVGGYEGKRANDTESLTGIPTTFRTAKRFDAAAGYKVALFNVGAEYFYAKNWNDVTINPTTYAYSQDSARGYSAFGNVNITPQWAVFGRYDWNQPNRITDNALRDHYYNIGLQWEPVKIVDIALVYKRETVRNGAISTTDGVIGCGTAATANDFTTSATLVSGTCLGNGTYDEVGLWGQFKF